MISAIVCIAVGVWLIYIGRKGCKLAEEMLRDTIREANDASLDAKYGGTEIEPFTVGRN